ncbi:MAG TPA: DsbA family oxidoreductase [Stellaceae bacterium]|nr:DsbA family oxidoreductase [Stellaceae bacterium]
MPHQTEARQVGTNRVAAHPIVIDIVSDIVCPWCFIGKRRLERALAERPDVRPTLRWCAFQLNPELPAEGVPRGPYMAAKFGGADHAERLQRSIEEAGRREDIRFDFGRIDRIPNSLDAHRLIRWAGYAARQDVAIDALFRAYFEDGRDIGQPTVLIDIATEIGFARTAAEAWLTGDADRLALKADDRAARQRGITGVPCYIVAGKYAISGAQEPEFFLPLLDLVTQGRVPTDE